MEKSDQSTRCVQMYRLIEKWQQSEKTQKAFCGALGQSKGVFNYWLRKYRDEKQGASTGFAKIETEGSGSALEIIYPNGVSLILPVGTDPLINYADFVIQAFEFIHPDIDVGTYMLIWQDYSW